MKLRSTLLSIAVVAAAGCQKAPGPSQPAPVANFKFYNTVTTDVLTVGTYDDSVLTNTSVNAVSQRWDFGNDSLKTTSDAVFHYAKPGTYTLTLTVQNADHQSASISRKVNVLDRVVKQVAIIDIADRVGSPQHQLVNATYWVVVRLGENGVKYPMQSISNPSFDAPIVYQSPKVSGLTYTNLPYMFTIPTKLVVNFPALRSYLGQAYLGYAGVGYGLELYGQDATGTYLLSTSYMPFYQSPSGSIGSVGTDIEKNVFTAVYGDIRLIGDYE
jgi:PKD repeat protein